MPANDRLLLGKAGMAAMGGQIQPSSARKKIGMVFHVEHFVVTEVGNNILDTHEEKTYICRHEST